MKNNKWLITGGIILLTLTLIGVSFAFFSPIIKGNEDAGENTFNSGTMELTFKENTDNTINLENARPGDSAFKTFTVENTGTLEDMYTYNIKLTELKTTFKEKDLTYTLQEYTDDSYETPKENGLNVNGFINEKTVKDKEMYLAVKINRPENTQKHYYKLTITFEELKDVNQNYNQGAEFSGKINIDTNANAELYDTLQENLFYATMMSNPEEVSKDDFGNLRYVGATPNNYIWFNCNDYDFVEPTDDNTYEKQASEKQCEKWRIIGLFKDIKTVTEEGQDKGTENLVKIVRAESLTPNLSWDNKDTTTEAESNKGKNDWTEAELMYLLNPNNSEHKLNDVTANNSLYWDSKEGQCSYNSNNKTTTCNFISTGLKNSGPTKSMIESVKWNLGGTPNYQTETTPGFYTAERGEETYKNSRPTTWNGKVGLIYPSDYGYATAGGTEKTRKDCLAYQLYNWSSGDYKTDCAGNDWLKPSSGSYLWTLTPSSASLGVFYVLTTGLVSYTNATSPFMVRPSLYLTSNVGIKEITNQDEDKPYGSETNPYILTIE